MKNKVAIFAWLVILTRCTGAARKSGLFIKGLEAINTLPSIRLIVQMCTNGTENYGGPILTAGGLLFIAATKDERFRGFDMRDGALLWETKLPAGGYATPATYMIDGRQFVVVAAGGGKMGTKSGDAYVAFALPDD